MPIEERVSIVLAEETEREKNSDFRNLRDFYEGLKREGWVVKQEYSLPPVDTVGRSLYLGLSRQGTEGQTKLEPSV